MYNHARTLLMNVDGGPQSGYPGDELIPTYKAVQLPHLLEGVRAQLFGTSPDRHMLNYRVRQLLALTHATPLEEYLLAKDPRVTYRLDTDDWPDSVFAPAAVRLAGPGSASLTVIGSPTPPDASGRCYLAYEVEVTASDTVKVTRRTAPGQIVLFELAVTDGLSDAVPLPGSGYSVLLSSDLAQVWQVSAVNRPQLDPSALAEAVASLSEQTFNALFGVTDVEPYATFRALWFRKRELPLRLGALVCALVYRTDERRLNG